MNDEQTAKLCELVSRAHLAGVHTSRRLWSRVANALDAVCDDDKQPPRQLASQLLAATLCHPSATAVPRDPLQARELLRWLREQWSARGWSIPPELTSDPPYPADPTEMSYKTYVGWGGAEGVTLLESVAGIVHNTTGLTTWYGAAVLASWAVDNPAILAGRRVLELGAGVGFTASVILKSHDDPSHPPPSTYVVTDCHHHVLCLLHYNLSLNLTSPTPERENLEKFQREMSVKVGQEEVEAGEVVKWTPPPPPASAAAVTDVRVMQVDWRLPPLLPPTDVLLAADVVYARHLIPPLVTLIRSVLDGSASRRPTDDLSREREDEAWEGVGEENDDGRRGREAFIACTRRNQETLAVFLDEVSRQGLQHSLVYQATLDVQMALFLYDETHLPVKIFRITLQ